MGFSSHSSVGVCPGSAWAVRPARPDRLRTAVSGRKDLSEIVNHPVNISLCPKPLSLVADQAASAASTGTE